MLTDMAVEGRSELKFNKSGWEDVERAVILAWGRPAAERIAAACNEESAAAEHPGFYHGEPTTDEEKRGYRAGTETENRVGWQLHKRSYRATAITATEAAMADNARHNRLITNLHHASEGM
jgi:hypothetical protein